MLLHESIVVVHFRDPICICCAAMPVGDLDVLPVVLVEKILLLLDLEALLAAASTCKGFCSLLIGRSGECLTLVVG